jgi:UDPglucose 6-dehydrogenase/GDP-mannose 6-dehydrogenase
VKIAIVGTGYVGLVSGACFSEIGHEVVCVDVDQTKVDSINSGVAPFTEEGLDELLARSVRERRLRATTRLEDALEGAVVSMIAVGTPFDGKTIDLKYVRSAAQSIGETLRGRSDYHVVCVKSTVVPSTTETVVGPIVESASGRRLGESLGLAMNPEFLAEGSAVQDFMRPDRIVIGANDARSAETIRALYAPFTGTDVVITTPSTAEMIKYAANSFLATVISFSNEIANLCSAVGGVDVVDVVSGVHLDRRLSPITPAGRLRPGLNSFLFPGTGFGGSCFPKDVKALMAFGEQIGAPMRILNAVMDTNLAQPAKTVDLVREALGALAGRRVAVLGLAFKPGTDDVRESPAIPIVRGLVSEGALVTAHDPVAIEPMQRVLGDLAVDYRRDLSDALRGAEAVILVTSWPEYRQLPALLAGRTVAVIDGRRFLSPDAFADYHGIGRREIAPASSCR